MHGLRDILEPSATEAEYDTIQDVYATQGSTADGGVSMLGFSELIDPVLSPMLLHSELAGRLCLIYLRQVDPIIKILHRPSLRRWMLDGTPYLGYADDNPSVEALRYAVCYAAVSSLTPNQCARELRMSKNSLAAGCRTACEAAIAKAGLLVTREVIVLQSFVLYLVGDPILATNLGVCLHFAC